VSFGKRSGSGGSNGAVIWQGPSEIGRGQVVIALTWRNDVAKLGPMVQAWILNADVAPHVAVSTGDDEACCGDCPRRVGHTRPLADMPAGFDPVGRCYVNTAAGAREVYAALPTYERMSPADAAARLTGQRLRIGAYGDPAAHAAIWPILTRYTSGRTGYTHHPDKAPILRGLVMASADTAAQASRLRAEGWGTYRARAVTRDGTPEPLERYESICPATAEGGKVGEINCFTCLRCDGSLRHVASVDHSGVTRSRLASLRRSREGATLTA
jgi:hypothetical protein